jgi:hypothetical protein
MIGFISPTFVSTLVCVASIVGPVVGVFAACGVLMTLAALFDKPAAPAPVAETIPFPTIRGSLPSEGERRRSA